MQFKKFTFLFLMGIFGLFTTNLFAQDATIDPSEIQYWVGEGENQVVVALSWCSYTETALAWGYRFNGEATVFQALTDIAAADSRLTVVGSAPSNITYVDGVMAQYGIDQQTVGNGSYVKFGDTNCGTDPAGTWTYVWEKEVAAVYPLAEEAKIDASEILYWVGEGENQAIFCVNWADPNIALAWGYRFNGENVTVKEMMDAIKEADGRFDYEVGSWGVTDITYKDENLNLGITEYSYFMYNVNGLYAWYGYDEQTIVNGDFVKFGDVACGTEIAEWTYVWTKEVEPVSVYVGLNENTTSTLAVYPNPAVGETFVTLENAGLNEVSVYDVQGRLVSSESFVANAGEQVRLSTAMLNAGVYFVRVNSDNNVMTAKLIVK